MITIAEKIEEIIRTTPFLEEGLARGIINGSALAREMQPRIAEALLKDVSESAVLMALKRLTRRLEARQPEPRALLEQMGDLTVRSNLVEFTFRASDTIVTSQKRLLDRARKQTDCFITFTRGVYEVTLVVSEGLAEAVETLFANEKRVVRLDDLSAIIIKLPAQSVSTPGVHYALLKQLAFENINVVEVVSTYTELTVVLARDQVDRSFSVLHRYLSGSRG